MSFLRKKISTLGLFNPFTDQTYFNEPSGGADGFDGFHFGVKWDSSQLITYSFKSTHGPVLNGSNEVETEAYDWFAKSSDDFYDFGKTLGPNGNHEEPVVLEPATMFLLGSGLIGGAFVKRRRKV